jgi:N-acyl homoserine lactone hydrolase
MATEVSSLTVLDFGRADIDLGRVMAPGDRDGVWAVCAFPGFLVELNGGRRVLIDNGPNRRHIHEPMYEYAGTDFGEHLKTQLTNSDDPVNRLAELGLDLGDIDTLVLTHTHFDHAGNTADFADTRIVIHRDAYEFGRDRWERGIPGGIPDNAHDGSPLDYLKIDRDTELAPGFTLLETPGHAPGHLSVLLDLPETGAVILAIDAIYSQVNIDRNNFRVAHDSDQARQSAERLVQLAEEHDAWLIYGHDPEQWETIRKAPDTYR